MDLGLKLKPQKLAHAVRIAQDDIRRPNNPLITTNVGFRNNFLMV